jgi:hypothetical protein
MGRSLLNEGTQLIYAKTNYLDVYSIAYLGNVVETAYIVAAAPASTQPIYVLNGSVQYFTSTANTNWIFNITGSTGPIALDSLMQIGRSMSFTVVTTQGGSGFYTTSIQIDGTTSGVTTRWILGAAPTFGNTNSLDVYSFTVIKTASNTFTVLASRSKFA